MRVGFYQSLIGVACIATTCNEVMAVQVDALVEAGDFSELAQIESGEIVT